MQIADLKISGFRGVQNAKLRLSAHNVFIGPNNCGKTTVLEALALLFGRDRLIRELTEHDFFGSDPQPADRISIVATIIGFAGNDPNQYTGWFRDDRGVPKWWNPTAGTIHAAGDANANMLACQIGLAARFDREDLSVEVIRYFHDEDTDDVFDADVVKRVPSQVIRDIGFFLVPANRTWDRTISFGSELFRRVVSSIGGQPAAAVLTERDRLRQPAQPLETDAGLSGIIGDVESELKGLLGKTIGLKLRLTATDSDGVLESVMPHYTSEGQHQVPARRQGSGLVSLQHLLLLLHFGRIRARQNQSFLMAMEEPELHVPPPVQRKLIHRIRSLSTQTIIVTHSPTVASASDPTALTVVHNTGGQLRSAPLLSAPLPITAPNWKRVLYLTRRQDTVAALMHEVVLVPEGRIDFDFINLLVGADEIRRQPVAVPAATPDFGSLVAAVPTQDGNVQGVYEELSPIHKRVYCLVDGDGAGTGYATTLLGLATPPAIILQWPVNWTIENLIGWIAEANAAIVLPLLSTALGHQFVNVTDFVTRLKSDVRPGGYKQDNIAYENIVSVLAEDARCLARLRHVLERIAAACSGSANPAGWNREANSTANTIVYRLVP